MNSKKRLEKDLEKGRINIFMVKDYLHKHTKKKTDRKLRKAGYHLCDGCKGNGFTKKRQIGFRKFGIDNRRHFCVKCTGSGVVDWVQKVLR